ncbi:MAG: hypothetical protein FWD37_06500, partial [Methanomassiliicoccaceae archaeon]|nr:hypothetical protein [Methanomassiliicoccaceae archaeon]
GIYKGVDNLEPEEPDILAWWARLVGRDRYINVIHLLQEEAGLTFKEAKAWLLPRMYISRLAKDWECTEKNIYKLRSKASDKIETTDVMTKIPVRFYNIL